MASMKHGHAKGRRKKHALFSAGRTLGYIAFVRGTFCGAVRVLCSIGSSPNSTATEPDVHSEV